MWKRAWSRPRSLALLAFASTASSSTLLLSGFFLSCCVRCAEGRTASSLLQLSVWFCCSTAGVMQSCLGSICSRGLRSRTTFRFVCVAGAGAGGCRGHGRLCRCHPVTLRSARCRPRAQPLPWLERKRCAWKTATASLNICVCVCGLHIAERRRDAVASLARRVRASHPRTPARFKRASAFPRAAENSLVLPAGSGRGGLWRCSYPAISSRAVGN